MSPQQTSVRPSTMRQTPNLPRDISRSPPSSRLVVSRRASLLLTAALSILCLQNVLPAFAVVPCNETVACEALLRPGSVCGSDGLCTNPFAGGCLRRMLGEDSYPNVRVCNSNDDAAASGPYSTSPICSRSKFNYTEIRVSPGNWETSMFFSWIIQILLSERLDVPVSIENGLDGGSFDFYDVRNSLSIPKIGYNFDAIEEGHRVGDCGGSNVDCAHILPEVWNGQEKAWTEAQRKGFIEPPEGNGMVGKMGWFIPKFVAERDPSLVSYLGLKNNRTKLANMFHRPITWLEYCRDLSTSNCENDGVAQRWPRGDAERASYFSAGGFQGHFRPTDMNNCTLNPESCTGHIVDAPCTWSTNTESQAYWNNISLESDGPMQPNGGYSYSHMIQIWKAANATKSNVIMWWWRPDATVQAFRGSSAEFQPVLLPEATEECAENRLGSKEERCSSDATVRRGRDALGSCDSEAHSLQKIIAKSLYDDTYGVPMARRSAGYETIKSLRVSDLKMDDMLQTWSRLGVDAYGFDAREAVCSWVADNIQDLDRFFPQGYPRVMEEEGIYRQGYLYAAQAVGAFATVVVLGTAMITYHWRERRAIAYANPNFLFLTLLGFLLVCIGAIVFVLEPSLASCVSKQWLVTLGYTLGLVPLLVKVAAINKIAQGIAKCKRVSLPPRYLFGVVAAVVSCVLVYLIVWTLVDPPTRGEDWVLATEGGRVVEVSLSCSCSPVWVSLALAWELLLLVCASVLAFQARGFQQDFNESKSLATMVYVHFVFMLLRGIMWLLRPVVRAGISAGVTSFLLSLDTLITLSVYFGPKLFLASKRETYGGRRRSSSLFSQNCGNNTDPTSAACREPGPRCSNVTNVTIPMGQGSFSAFNPKNTARTSLCSWPPEEEGKAIDDRLQSRLAETTDLMEANHAEQLARVKVEAEARLRRLNDMMDATLKGLELKAATSDSLDAGMQEAVAKAREDMAQLRLQEMEHLREAEACFENDSSDLKLDSFGSIVSETESELELQLERSSQAIAAHEARMAAEHQARMAYRSFSAIGEYSDSFISEVEE